MEKITTAIIGGGASGLILATTLKKDNQTIVLFERNDRVGKKLSSTGNGQGNLTNAAVLEAEYFTSSAKPERITQAIQRYDNRSFTEFLHGLGVLLITDDRGRVYPSGRQASAVTDALRFYARSRGVTVMLSTKITAIKKTAQGFVLTAETPDGSREYLAQNVVLATGGKAAKNFGTDGSAYALAERFGHTLTRLQPSLVQLKTDTAHIKTLKGIRVNDAALTAYARGKGRTVVGDVIFTDYGVSGDAVFRISAFIADALDENTSLSIDFLPEFSLETIEQTLQNKRASFPDTPVGELLCGVVNNQIGRAIFKRAKEDISTAARLVKAFPLEVKGSLGFDYAQVTKGGVRMDEVDDDLQSKKTDGLYFTGEILDVDGQCGGFNLQWAYTSARIVAAAIDRKISK